MSKHHDFFNVPPNKANPTIVLPLTTPQEVDATRRRLRLTAADVETPIDWRKKATLSPVRNQATCGNCWAMSSTSALTDRFIISGKYENLNLAPVLTTQCAGLVTGDGSGNNGCCGGLPTT